MQADQDRGQLIRPTGASEELRKIFPINKLPGHGASLIFIPVDKIHEPIPLHVRVKGDGNLAIQLPILHPL